VVARFEDAALSGFGVEHRPGYRALVAAAVQVPPLFDLILVEDVSRLTRDLAEVLRLYHRLRLRGVDLVGVSDGIRHRRGVRQFQGPRAERRLIAELLDAYERQAEARRLKSLPQIRSRAKRLRDAFRGYRALAVTHEALIAYVRTRQTEGAADATINRELELISSAFALAVKSGTLAYAPKVPSLPEDNARSGFFERADFEAVVKHLKDDAVRDFVEWFFWTGMRPEEIRSLTWADFDRETWVVRLHARDAKTGHGRPLALVEDLRAVMERRLGAPPDLPPGRPADGRVPQGVGDRLPGCGAGDNGGPPRPDDHPARAPGLRSAPHGRPEHAARWGTRDDDHGDHRAPHPGACSTATTSWTSATSETPSSRRPPTSRPCRRPRPWSRCTPSRGSGLERASTVRAQFGGGDGLGPETRRPRNLFGAGAF
jgi:DNA invertase Pin-like site-specific DNA recombinase